MTPWEVYNEVGVLRLTAWRARGDPQLFEQRLAREVNAGLGPFKSGESGGGDRGHHRGRCHAAEGEGGLRPRAAGIAGRCGVVGRWRGGKAVGWCR